VTPAANSDLQALYGHPPERFVAERNALVSRLRADGDNAQAERIAKLRRPTLAASAINRAVLQWPGKASGLVAAGRELRRVHENALKTASDPELLRSAARQERSAVEDMEDAALQILREEGKAPSADVERRLRETLEAVALDDDVMERFANGMLEQEHRASAISPPGFTAQPAPADEAKTRQRDEALRAAEANLRRARRLASSREQKVERARVAQARAQSELNRAENELAAARVQVEDAEREVKRLRRG
jgi:hypothetical protein